MTLQIVKAGLSDISPVMKLEKISFAEDAWPLIDMALVLINPGGIRYKALVNGNFAGFAAAEIDSVKHSGWISTIAVMPEYRHQGVGRMLLDACQKDIHEPVICLCVDVQNLTALKLYKKMNYVETDLWKDYYAEGRDAIVMQMDNK